MTDSNSAQELAGAIAALAQAERANAAKSRFLAAASHDLRQPLQALRLLNAALQEYLLSDDMAMNILHDSERALEVMDRLLSSLLDISKIDSGVIVPDMRAYAINDIFNDLRGDFLRLAQEKNLEFTIVPCRHMVLTDRIMIDAMLRNLLSNAIRYTKRGKILLGCRRAGPNIRFEVWDTGTGIPDAQIASIFDEFYQIGAPDRDSRQGLGLGLSIVRGYARLLRTPVQVRSRMGAGSVFSFEAPIADAASAGAGGAQENPDASARWDLRGCRILLIEDDIQALEALQKLLGLWGAHVLGATGGAEAAALLAQENFAPDIVITDFRLRDGETGIAAINHLGPHVSATIPVIFITGDSMAEVRRALGTRYTHLLQKPVAPGKLRVLIRNLRSGSR
ncbi:MAG: hybrid sensor histidine kinase/response regulator [Pseudomonadota bacterium]